MIATQPNLPRFSARNPGRPWYLDDKLRSSLDELRPEAAATLREVYARLLEIYKRVQFAARENNPVLLLNDLLEGRFMMEFRELTNRLRELEKTEAPVSGEARQDRLRKNLHDVRGGALDALSLHIEYLVLLDLQIKDADVQRALHLSGDHLKIMRHCFADLDRERGHADRARHFHSSEILGQKWTGFRGPEKTVRFQALATANIATCCLEFATLDRMIYNLMNNALRHGSGELIELRVSADDDREPKNLIVSVTNAISTEHQALLKERFGDNMGRIFLGGFTTKGSGDGLRICSEYVGSAYGHDTVEEALEAGLFGAELESEKLRVWFYWPLLPETVSSDLGGPAPMEQSP